MTIECNSTRINEAVAVAASEEMIELTVFPICACHYECQHNGQEARVTLDEFGAEELIRELVKARTVAFRGQV